MFVIPTIGKPLAEGDHSVDNIVKFVKNYWTKERPGKEWMKHNKKKFLIGIGAGSN
jgi:hypothetical protein